MQILALLQNLFAGAVVVVCLALLGHQFLGASRRHRLDTWLARTSRRIEHRLQTAWRWRSTRQFARRETEAAIRRAREQASEDAGEWDGNVYRPKSFRKPRKLH